MKYLIFGGSGLLGSELCAHLRQKAVFLAPSSSQVDILNREKVFQAALSFLPDVIINAAAYTAVDLAESEQKRCFQVNVDGANNIAQAAEKVGAKMLHFSSDYVFDGEKTTPYEETDKARPLNIYGQSKLASEWAVQESCSRSIIVRTAGLFGVQGKHFVQTIMRLAEQKKPLSIIANQISSPTWAADLARAAILLSERHENAQNNSVYHFSGCPAVSWFDFAQAIMDEALSLQLLPQKPIIRAIDSCDYPGAAKRPAYSVLSHQKIQAALTIEPSDWRLGVHLFLHDWAKKKKATR